MKIVLTPRLLLLKSHLRAHNNQSFDPIFAVLGLLNPLTGIDPFQGEESREIKQHEIKGDESRNVVVTSPKSQNLISGLALSPRFCPSLPYFLTSFLVVSSILPPSPLFPDLSWNMLDYQTQGLTLALTSPYQCALIL